jgi:hypothetical protein
MVKYYKIIFVFILLLSGRDLIAEDRYLSWIEPKSQNRSKINLKTQELLVEKVSSGWLKEGKITLDTSILVQLPREVKSNYFFFENGEKIRFTIDGTGLVFDYYVRKKELIRVDNTYHSGYNYFSTKFLRKGIIYSAGGVGFWNYSSAISYFNEQTKEWEILKPKNEIHIPISSGYNGYNEKLDVFYTGGSRVTKYLENLIDEYSDDLYRFDFKTNSWDFLGKLNPDLPFKKYEAIFWTGEIFLHTDKGNVYIIDPQSNEVRFYEDNGKIIDFGFDQFINNDTIKSFLEKNGGNSNKISISELKRNSTYWGTFYNTGISKNWYYLIAILIVGIVSFLLWTKKHRIQNSIVDFTITERKLLEKFLELNNEEFLSTNDVNDILDTSNKSLDNQRRIRVNLIKDLNEKLNQQFSVENAIERKSLTDDKRLTSYRLNNQIRIELLNLFNK